MPVLDGLLRDIAGVRRAHSSRRVPHAPNPYRAIPTKLAADPGGVHCPVGIRQGSVTPHATDICA